MGCGTIIGRNEAMATDRYEIKTLADGFGIYRDGVYVQWCHSKEWAEYRLMQYRKKDTPDAAAETGTR